MMNHNIYMVFKIDACIWVIGIGVFQLNVNHAGPGLSQLA